MTELRENLLDRIIHIYGFEHEITISFAELCIRYPQDDKIADKELEEIVEYHEQNPQFEEDEDWKNLHFF